ncbi:MAG TPA: hypothetical protein VFA67_17685 [Candidatus Sulfotelmatobacter sp.]|nr:hypothetical protein [Candidatus Sulfotelmatobacter sp.]
MIICLDLSQRTKDELDKLLEAGYRDYSEAVAVAIANQLLLHNRPTGDTQTIVLPEQESNWQPLEQKSGKAALSRPTQVSSVPTHFSYSVNLTQDTKGWRFAQYPTDTLIAGQDVLVDRWIFGQHNKLLPAKATCRALALIMGSGLSGDFALAKTASTIASYAVQLGDYLRHLDTTSGVHRDDALSFAFPHSDTPNNDKSRLRYANQFVASLTTNGALAGLPFELKLLNKADSRNPEILLTEAGWVFARLRNPILDDANDGSNGKFSNEEIEFLLSHIRSRVPAEAFAYKVVLEAIAQGARTPDRLDDALEEYLPKREQKPFTRAFLTTQRAGVVSRMIDLGLLQRIRDGVNVTYMATAKTFEFSPNPLRQVV